MGFRQLQVHLPQGPKHGMPIGLRQSPAASGGSLAAHGAVGSKCRHEWVSMPLSHLFEAVVVPGALALYVSCSHCSGQLLHVVKEGAKSRHVLGCQEGP